MRAKRRALPIPHPGQKSIQDDQYGDDATVSLFELIVAAAIMIVFAVLLFVLVPILLPGMILLGSLTIVVVGALVPGIALFIWLLRPFSWEREPTPLSPMSVMHPAGSSGATDTNDPADHPTDDQRGQAALPSTSAPSGGTVSGYGQQVTKAGWNNLPSSDPVFSAPEDAVRDSALVRASAPDGWRVVGASLRGLSHRHEGKFREDALAAAAVDDWHLAAVADGGGAYKLARVGARVAAEAALAAMRARLATLDRERPPSPEVGARAVLRAGLDAAYEALFEEGRRRERSNPPVGVKELRTTLLLLLHRDFGPHGHVVGGAQVGDGIVVARAAAAVGHLDPSDPPIRLGVPDTGPTGNEAVFLQDVKPDEWRLDGADNRRIFVKRLMEPVAYVLAMTDGVADDFLPLDKNLWRLEAALFKGPLAEPTPARAAEALAALLDYDDRPDSFDDRTLVCIYKAGTNPWK